MSAIPPERIDEMLELLRTGRYPRSVVWASMGYSPQACYMRERRDPEFAARVDQALAHGQMALLDSLFDAAFPRENGTPAVLYRPIEILLRTVHHHLDPVDQQRVELSRAKIAALQLMGSDEHVQKVKAVIGDLMTRRPTTQPQPPQPPADPPQEPPVAGQ